MRLYMNDSTEAETPLEPMELYELHKLNKAGNARIFVKLMQGGRELYRAIHYIDVSRSLEGVIVGNFDTIPPDAPIPFTITEQPETD